jgi:leucyl aminopeptidase
MIELSTLTGAMVVALGKHRAGLFTNSSEFAKRINSSSEEINEKIWNMPIDYEHR